ncbi:hypothetical protein SteCoe_27942 [Stentor coeruleus]|uniref:AAA-ATPase-like domain-containing protein n=1 Tax=Stentor coeruleus TaxID=5963 RepID=A0A1R2B9H0_9CILI|nr:hypothetical protein SteCoe_27942 [Stentor coeruleus]
MLLRFKAKFPPITNSGIQRFFSIVQGNKFYSGNQEFSKSVDKGNIFVDKSLLIKKLLNNDEGAIMFIRPQGWGKAQNLNMLKTFSQADVNKETGKVDYTGQSKIPEEVGKLTDYAFYQIFEKGYCEDLLKKVVEEKNNHWEKFILRASVFSPDKSLKKWILSMEKFEFDKIELESIVKTFNKLQRKNEKMRDFIKKFKFGPFINLV